VIPTFAQVRTLARAKLRVTDASPKPFVDARIDPHIQEAFARLQTEMRVNNLPDIESYSYANLDPYTGVIDPVGGLLIADFGSPLKLEDRAIDATIDATGATSASPVVVSVGGGHGLVTGMRVITFGFVGQTGANGEFYVSVSGNSITLNGSVHEGAYVSGGKLTRGTDQFREVRKVEDLSEREPSTELVEWEWSKRKIRLIPATQLRQIKLTYEVSSAPPTTGTMYVDDSLQYLGTKAAAEAALPEGYTTEYKAYNEEASVLLHHLIQDLVKAQQKEQPYRQMPFAERRLDLEVVE
jgi:hypothetical protein